MRSPTLAACAVAWLAGPPLAAQWTASRPDGHAPIGVMADHRHEAGEVMLAYRYMAMQMEGSRDGTRRISNSAIVDPAQYDFMVTPTRMPMQMHMFGVMFAPSHRITLLAMVPYVVAEMDHITRSGGSFVTRASGVGDVSVGALFGLANVRRQAVHATLGVRMPTGSIEQRDVLPTSGGNAVQLPYPMQLGSGTWDLEPGLTYLGQAGDRSWGGQLGGTVRLGENERGWARGSRFTATVWGAQRLTLNWSVSLRAAGVWVGDIEGMDPAPSVDPAVVPTARTDLRSGGRIDLAPGVNFYLPRAKALRFAAELLVPVYQDLDGPQLETDWTLIFGVQITPVQR